ncbi:MAG: S41 family peptidase [Roseiflexaceae bacterium]|nr:S41 family peptidase [Roseiflexaceae bacterium]
MSRFMPFLRTHALIGLIMMAIGFAGGWLSAKLLPVGGNVMALLGPGMAANEVTPSELRDDFGIFWEAWNLVENEFYQRGSVDRTKMIQGAIKGMLASLDDPYTVYQEPDLTALTNEYMRGTQEGIGIYMRFNEERAFVDRPIKNSPALKAGLAQDDEIVAVDGTPIRELIAGLDVHKANVEVASRIRGPKGSQVVLTIRRGEASPFDVAIMRDEIIISSVSGQLLDNQLAYIKITDFKSSTTEDFDTTMRELLPANPRGIVLDLRNNPGGFLTNAQEVLGRFYDGVALYEDIRGERLEEMRTIRGGSDVTSHELPIIVLVNEGSASASEIVAGALRDERSATFLLGEKTYGKGSVQNIHKLSDDGSARITFAHWITPDKTEIDKIGITPQYVVPYTEDAASTVPCVADRRPAEGQTTCADSQLAWALRMLSTGETPPQAAAAK